MKTVFRLALALTLISGLIACASSTMVMESNFDPQYTKKPQRVLIVANGQLFPEATRQVLFPASIDAVKRVLSRHGITSSYIQLQTSELNPSIVISNAARSIDATHVLFFDVSKVSTMGPQLPEGDSRNKLRMVTSYTYSFQLLDVQTRRNIWKGELRSGSGNSSEDTMQQIEERLKEHLDRAKLLNAPSKA